MIRHATRRAAGLVLAAVLAGCGGTGGGTDQSAGTAMGPVLVRLVTVPNVVAEAALTDLRANRVPLPAGSTVEFAESTTPDELRAGLVAGRVDVAILPTTAAANLAQRGVDVRLLGVLDQPLLSVLGPDGGPPAWEVLRGGTVDVAFRGDVADLLVRMLAEANGLRPDVDVQFRYHPQLPELVAEFATGRARFAVLPEPAASLALARAGTEGNPGARVLDLAAEWRSVTGAGSLPLMGVAMRGELADERPDLVRALQQHFAEATARARTSPDAVAQTVAAELELPPPLVLGVLQRAGAGFRTGQQARGDLAELYRGVLEQSPDVVGGGVPDVAFYS